MRALEIISQNDSHCLWALVAFENSFRKGLKSENQALIDPVTSDENLITVKCADGYFETSRLLLTSLSPVFEAMFSHMESNSFAEAKNKCEISLPEISIETLETVTRLARNPEIDVVKEETDNEDFDDLLEIDSFCRQFLIKKEIRALYQKLTWPRVKCCLLRNPSETLTKLHFTLEGPTGFFEWPFASLKILCEGRITSHMFRYVLSKFLRRLC